MKLKKLLAVVLICVMMMSGMVVRGTAGVLSLNQSQNDAFCSKMIMEAEANVTQEQIDEAYRIMEETEQFFLNLSPESLWEAYLVENHEFSRIGMSQRELLAIKLEVQALYDEIMANKDFSPRSLLPSGTLLAYTRHFSGHDGVGIIGRTAIEANGHSALNDAEDAFPNNYMKQDAYRHYLWNFSAVRNLAVYWSQIGRVRSTCIYTTNRELATNILRRYPSLDVEEPTANQLATALNLRNNFFDRTFEQWDALFTDEGGRDDLMDLWNNERGRQDGVNSGNSLTLFNNRWNANTVIKSNSTTDVTAHRRQFIWINGWYVPVRHPIW